jgi:hypothetical protein
MPFLVLALQTASAETGDLGNGFRYHGIATPISNHRGTVATVDGQGHNVVLAWLIDYRGGYELLLIDVDTGKAEEHPMPFPVGDNPFASILSSGNKFYTHFNSHFVEFDPARRAFTFSRKTTPQMAMSMTEDDKGVIWSVTYPQSGIVSFNPTTREFKDYGHVHRENWAQYPRSVAADDAGWIYFGIGVTRSQIVAFDPRTGEATPLMPEDQRDHGVAEVYRHLDGKVYGQANTRHKDNWYVFHKGQVNRIGAHDKIQAKSIIAGSQGLFHHVFPDGKRIKTFDPADRVLVVEDPKTRTTKAVHFDYKSEGASIIGVAAAPDNTIVGGTAYPSRFFSYDPTKDTWVNRAAHGGWNTLVRQGTSLFVGGYTRGFLLEWDPAKPWVPTKRDKKDSNPKWLAEGFPAINRPHELLAHPDGKTIVLAGTPDYGLTGGGLLFWDRTAQRSVVLTHKEVIPDQATMSLVALPDGKLLGGTTTRPGTGGEEKAKEAELYLMDFATRRLEWHRPVFPGVQAYTDLCLAPGGVVYGFAGRERFFVFDPVQRKVVHERNTKAEFGLTTSQQGPRVFVRGPNEAVYILFIKGIAKVEPRTFRIKLLAKSPVPVASGGDILNGRIYFANGARVYSYKVPE